MPQSSDEVDLLHLRETAQSAGYKLISGRIREMMATKFRELLRDLDPVETAKCRGFLEAIQIVVELPERIEAEIRESAKR